MLLYLLYGTTDDDDDDDDDIYIYIYILHYLKDPKI